MITKNFALNIQTRLTGNSFSLDELILEAENLFNNEGIPGFVGALLSFIDRLVMDSYKSSREVKFCNSTYLVKSGRRNKTIYTRLGKLAFQWGVLRCKYCHKVFYPLRDFLGIDKYKKLTNEFEKLCLEIVSRESFRKSTETLKIHNVGEFNHRTLHRWFYNTEADEILVTHHDLNVLLADGTKYKKFVSQNALDKKNKLREKLGKKPIEISKRGEVKILMGINHDNEVIPLGAWTSESWKIIGKMIYKANNQNKKLIPKKVANILVADGEIAINKGLKNITHHQQRCLWHIPHELKPLMKYQEKAEPEDVKYTLGQVHSIFQIEIPEKDFESIETKDLLELREKIKACEQQIKLLAEYLQHKGYNQAATYVDNARSNLFTYLRYWMKTGVVTPKVTSKLERLMREINRRIKKFAFNWSEKGCAKMTRIILKLITDRKFWDQYFDIKMRLSGNIKLSFEGIS
jgi:hypothetical protein